MTKRNLLLASLLLVFGLGVMAPAALAQGTVLTATTTVYTLRPNSNADAVGPIYLTYSSGLGTIAAGQTFNVLYSEPISGAVGINGLAATTAQADFCFTSGIPVGSLTCTDLAVSASGSTLTLTNDTAENITGWTAGYLQIYGVRVNTYGVASGSAITATVYTSINATYPFTFSNGTNVISTIVGTVASTTALTATGPTSPYSQLACNIYSDSQLNVWVDVTENWAGAWTSKNDEVARAPYLVTNGSNIAVQVTGIPQGLTVTPQTPFDVTGSQVWGATPAAYTGAVFNDSTTFVYTITNTERPAPPTPVTPESVQFDFILTNTAPLAQGNPAMAISVQLAPPPSTTSPVYPAFSYPVFGLAEETPGTPIPEEVFIDCITPLLFPYITDAYTPGVGPLGSWDTAMEVANMTSVPFPTTSGLYTLPQNGACTFSFYSAGTSTTVGTAKEAVPVTWTTPVILSGGNYAFMLSATPAAGLTGGYAVAVCDFLNGGGYAELVDNANGLGNWQVMAGYLAEVYYQPFY